MKIVIVGPAFPLRGGIANFNEALARSLQEEGHEVHIFSFYLQYPKILFPGKTQMDPGKGPGDLRISSTISSVYPPSWYSTARKIRKENPDLIITRFWLPFMGPSTGTILKKLKKTAPVIAITDNVIPHEKRPGDRPFTAYFIRQCDGFIAMSRAVLKDLEQFNSDKPRKFLPHPIYSIFGENESREEALSALGLDKEFRYLLFFGIIRKYKGLDILLEGLSHCDFKKHKIKLLVAGEFYEDEKYYRDLIHQYGLDDHVVVRSEFIPSDEVRHYFCASDLITQTYRTATQSGVTQIAYHFGRPMLVTDVGGLSEIVPHGKAGYVTSVDPVLIGQSIDDFFNHHREPAMSEAVKLEAKRFEWSYFVQGLMDLRAEILKS